MNKRIYLDNAATTKLSAEVLQEMMPYMTERFGNPSGIYDVATEAQSALQKARKEIATTLQCNENNIYFTSGGTEADNWALKSVAENYAHKGKHIITTKIEHHAILNTCSYLEKKGYEITYLDVDEQGIVNVEQLRQKLRPDTILVSVMMANNEIGTLQPTKEIGRVLQSHPALFHTDAVQAYGHIPIAIQEIGVDLMSASAHKFHGPKGAGFLYVGDNVQISSFLHGGKQERGLRAGTENVSAFVGMGKAASLAHENMEQTQRKVASLRDYMIHRIEQEISYCHLNGSRKKRLANNVNFSFQFVEGEALVILLDMEGICASAGSACSAGQTVASHVIQATGIPLAVARGTIRFSLDENTTKEEIDETITVLKRILDKNRGLNPRYTAFVQMNKKR